MNPIEALQQRPSITVAKNEAAERVMSRMRYHDSFVTTVTVSAAKAADFQEEGCILMGTAVDQDDCTAAMELGKDKQASFMCFLLPFVPETPPNAGDDWSWAVKELNWMAFCPHHEGRSFLLVLAKQKYGFSNAQLQALVHEVALAQPPAQAFAPSASAPTSTLSGLKDYFKEVFGDEKPDQGAEDSEGKQGKKKRLIQEAADDLKNTANSGQTWFVEGDRSADKRRCTTRPLPCRTKTIGLISIDQTVYVMGDQEFLGYVGWAGSHINMALLSRKDARQIISNTPPRALSEMMLKVAQKITECHKST